VTQAKYLFTDIYLNDRWGFPKSGVGSSFEATAKLREQLPCLMKSFKINSLFDAPCGDFSWMKLVKFHEGFQYSGGDIVPTIIEDLKSNYNLPFIEFDIRNDKFPKVDAWFCRLCLVHLSFHDIKAALDNFLRSDIRYLIASTNSQEINTDIKTGGYRPINLRKPPFSLPEPWLIEESISETQMGIWTKNEVLNSYGKLTI
jgi:hypothetical protein